MPLCDVHCVCVRAGPRKREISRDRRSESLTRFLSHFLMRSPPRVSCRDGLDHCFDCASEVFIWRRYLLCYAHLWCRGYRPRLSALPPSLPAEGGGDWSGRFGEGVEPQCEGGDCAAFAALDRLAPCKEPATPPEGSYLYTAPASQFTPPAASTKDVACTQQERELADLLPNADALGIRLYELDAEIAYRIDTTSRFLSRSRSLAHPHFSRSRPRGIKVAEVIRYSLLAERIGVPEEALRAQRELAALQKPREAKLPLQAAETPVSSAHIGERRKRRRWDVADPDLAQFDIRRFTTPARARPVS